ncbi:proteoglycan 4-like [Helianthus annuus]|uniref:proteoglycan 4-like n=1 Tax=Helianthus annuus TaxID=4232 RepID=UPI000B8EF96E|nr:proteoglycan 4-like [Helianthus annuus]
MEDVLKNIVYELDLDEVAVDANKEKVVEDIERDDVNKSTTSSSSSSEDEVDEIERLRRIQEETAKEKQLKKRKRQEKDDAAYIPSPEHVSESQSPSGAKKKVGARKRIVSPKIKKVTPKITKPKIVLKKKSSKEPSKPSTPPPEPTPHQTPPRQPTPQRQPSPPKQPTPPRQPSPLHLSPPHQTPPHEQPFLTSQEIFKTPPPTQIQIQLTPGSSSHKMFPSILENLEDIGDFGFANDEQVKKIEKKMDDVLNENKRLAAESKKVADREKILKMRVKKLECENKSLLKKIDTDQTEIDILKVRVAELEEEKTRRDEQNKYFELKNKELEAAKALKEHEFYMMKKVIESMLGSQ